MPHLAHLRDDHIIVSCTKGVLNDTLETVAEVRARMQKACVLHIPKTCCQFNP